MDNRIEEREAHDRAIAAAARFKTVQAKVDACHKVAEPASILESGLIEAQYEWRKAAAEYSRALSAYSDNLQDTLQRIFQSINDRNV
jgi:hypothetical protein